MGYFMKKTSLLFNQYLLMLALAFMPVLAKADRTVKFVPTGKKIKVSNPSTNALTYSITCKNGSGTNLLNLTGQALPAGQSREHTNAGTACTTAGYVSDTMATFQGGMIKCSDSMAMTPVAYSDSLCGLGYHLCSPPEFSENKSGGASGSDSWLSAQGYANWSAYEWDGMAWTWIDRDSTYAPVADPMSSSSQCATGMSGGGAKSTYCRSRLKTDNLYSYMCCPDTVGFCQITVTGDTGYLITPDFKGGTPF
jgi:hypothetical protein